MITICRRLMIRLLAVVVLAQIVAAQTVPPLDTLRQGKWREDLRYLAREMPKVHKDLFHAMKREDFLKAVSSLYKRMPQLNTDETLVELSRLLAMIGDDHSGYVEPLTWNSDTNYPLKLSWYDSGIYVQRAPREYEYLVGGQVVKIGNRAIADVLKDVSQIFPHDTGNMAHVHVLGVPLYLTQARVLHGLHVEPTRVEATYTIEKDGRSYVVTLRPTASTALIRSRTVPNGWVDAESRSTAPMPLWRLHPEKNFWFEYLPNERALYFQLNEVNNEDTETIEEFSQRLFPFIDTHDVQKLIVDLRNNLGGDNTKLRPLVLGIARSRNINQRGHLFVLIGPSTHSAAQSFVDRLENSSEAIFVGEPSGQNVNFFSDTEDIVLPNSGLHIGMSKLWWQDAGPLDTRAATYPEIAVAGSFADYVNHNDPVLQTVLARMDFPSFQEVLTAALRQGSDALTAAYRKWAEDPFHRYFDTEDRAEELGFSLLRRKQSQEAVALFRANVEMHPNSPNAWDSLGYGYAKLGDRQSAISAYSKSLSLNPSDATALKSLERLKASQR